ncbi:MAG: hypothetical protein NT138_23295 [Planctomycetales bacterium]|nr:hypothetical protein [Planctomycetales bacterium]
MFELLIYHEGERQGDSPPSGFVGAGEGTPWNSEDAEKTRLGGARRLRYYATAFVI